MTLTLAGYRPVSDRAAQNCPTFPGMGTRLHRPVDDPATISSSEDERTVAFRRARDELNNKIEAWLAEQVDRRDPRAQRSEQGV